MKKIWFFFWWGFWTSLIWQKKKSDAVYGADELWWSWIWLFCVDLQQLALINNYLKFWWCRFSWSIVACVFLFDFDHGFEDDSLNYHVIGIVCWNSMEFIWIHNQSFMRSIFGLCYFMWSGFNLCKPIYVVIVTSCSMKLNPWV